MTGRRHPGNAAAGPLLHLHLPAGLNRHKSQIQNLCQILIVLISFLGRGVNKQEEEVEKKNKGYKTAGEMYEEQEVIANAFLHKPKPKRKNKTKQNI